MESDKNKNKNKNKDKNEKTKKMINVAWMSSYEILLEKTLYA